MNLRNPIAISIYFLGFIIVFPFFESPYLIPKLLVLNIAGVCLFWWKKLCIRPIPIWVAIIFIWPFISLLWSINMMEGLLTIMMFSAGLIPLLFQIKPAGHRPFQYAILAAAWVTMLTGILQRMGFTFLPVETPVIMSSLFGNSWLSSQFVLLCLWFTTKNRAQTPHIIIMCLYILIGGNKTVYLGLIYWSLICLSEFGLLRKYLPCLSVAFIIAGGLWVRSQPGELFAYMLNPDTYTRAYGQQEYLLSKRDKLFKGKPLSLMSRLIMWKNAGMMVVDRPLLGSGVGQFKIIYPRFSQAVHPDPNINGMYRPVSAHSFPLGAAAELGIPWTIGLLALCSWYWRHLKSNRHRHALIYCLFSCLVQPFYLTLPLWFVFLLAPSKAAGHNGSLDDEESHRSKPIISASWWPIALLLLISSGSIFLSMHNIRVYLSQTAVSSSDVHADFPFRKAELLHREGRTKEANNLFQTCLKTDPYSAEALYNLLQTSDMTPERINEKKILLQNAYPFFRPLIKTSKTSAFPSEYNPLKERIRDLAPTILEIKTTR